MIRPIATLALILILITPLAQAATSPASGGNANTSLSPQEYDDTLRLMREARQALNKNQANQAQMSESLDQSNKRMDRVNTNLTQKTDELRRKNEAQQRVINQNRY